MKKMVKMARTVIDLVEIKVEDKDIDISDLNNYPYTVIDNLDVLDTNIIEVVGEIN